MMMRYSGSLDNPRLKATTLGKSGISAPYNGMLFHCHIHTPMVLYQGGPLCLAHCSKKTGQLYISCIDRQRGHPDTGPWVCDGLIQMHTAVKQHCIGGSWLIWCNGLNPASKVSQVQCEYTCTHEYTVFFYSFLLWQWHEWDKHFFYYMYS